VSTCEDVLVNYLGNIVKEAKLMPSAKAKLRIKNRQGIKTLAV